MFRAFFIIRVLYSKIVHQFVVYGAGVEEHQQFLWEMVVLPHPQDLYCAFFMAELVNK